MSFQIPIEPVCQPQPPLGVRGSSRIAVERLDASWSSSALAARPAPVPGQHFQARIRVAPAVYVQPRTSIGAGARVPVAHPQVRTAPLQTQVPAEACRSGLSTQPRWPASHQHPSTSSAVQSFELLCGKPIEDITTGHANEGARLPTLLANLLPAVGAANKVSGCVVPTADEASEKTGAEDQKVAPHALPEEAARRAAEEAALQAAAEEAARLAAAEEAARRAAEEEVARRAAEEEEVARRVAEEAALQAAVEEAARLAAAEEAARRAAEEEVARRAAEEEEAARRVAGVAALQAAAEEAARLAAAEEAARRAAEEEVARRAAEEEEAALRAAEEAAFQAAAEEAAHLAAAEEAAFQAAEEAALQAAAEEAARLAAEEEAARLAAAVEAARLAAEGEAARRANEEEAARRASQEAPLLTLRRALEEEEEEAARRAPEEEAARRAPEQGVAHIAGEEDLDQDVAARVRHLLAAMGKSESDSITLRDMLKNHAAVKACSPSVLADFAKIDRDCDSKVWPSELERYLRLQDAASTPTEDKAAQASFWSRSSPSASSRSPLTVRASKTIGPEPREESPEEHLAFAAKMEGSPAAARDASAPREAAERWPRLAVSVEPLALPPAASERPEQQRSWLACCTKR